MQRLRPVQLATLLCEHAKIGVGTMRRYIWLVERGEPCTAAAQHVLGAVANRFPEVLNG